MARFVSLTILVILAGSARAGAAASTSQPAEGFDLREWAVFVLDASQNTLNPQGLVTSSLPSFVTTQRDVSDAAKSRDPSPVGIIRLIGNSEKKVDVTIEGPGGSFLASWPQAEKRSKQLLWRNVRLGRGSPRRQAEEAVPDDHWFHELRRAESAYLWTDNRPAEQFLLYDVEMHYRSPLGVTVGKDHSIAVANRSDLPLHHLVIYQWVAGSWRQGTVGDVPAAAASSAPATKASTAPAAVPPSVFSDTPGSALASTSAVGTGPTTTPAKAPSTRPAPGLAVAMTPTTRPSDLTDPWEPALQQLGVSEVDSGVIVSIIAAALRGSHKLAAVYLMDAGEFNRLLPLEVVPEPRTIARVGVVIVRNADPNEGTDVDDLIAQLGDPSWSKRDEAFKALAKIGPSAEPKLHAAAQSKDVEVAWRAEKLLAMLKK